jgi:outer membrane protein OmpA-like peptidoglycan-associated protein
VGTRWGHRALGARWWAAALVVPVALAGLVVAVDGDDLEADIRERVEAALAGDGFRAADVEVDGREVTVSGLPAGSNTGAVRHTVRSVDGVSDVLVEEPPVLGTGRCPRAQRRIDRILGRDKVHFEPGSAALSGRERRQVAAVGVMLRRCAASVTVRGNVADPREESVTPLSQRRAQAVADVLTARGGVVDAVVGGMSQPLGRAAMNHYVAIVVS